MLARAAGVWAWDLGSPGWRQPGTDVFAEQGQRSGFLAKWALVVAALAAGEIGCYTELMATIDREVRIDLRGHSFSAGRRRRSARICALAVAR